MRTSISFATKAAAVSVLSVAVVGGFSGVASAQSTDWGMNGSMRQMKPADMQHMMHDNWNNSNMKPDQMFDKQVREYLNQAYAQMGAANKQSLFDFYKAYEGNWMSMQKQLNNARVMYMPNGQFKSDQDRDKYHDAYNRTMSDFFNNMEAAKNKLAGEMDRQGMAVYKDMFMNHYNMAKDKFSSDMRAKYYM